MNPKKKMKKKNQYKKKKSQFKNKKENLRKNSKIIWIIGLEHLKNPRELITINQLSFQENLKRKYKKKE